MHVLYTILDVVLYELWKCIDIVTLAQKNWSPVFELNHLMQSRTQSLLTTYGACFTKMKALERINSWVILI